MVNHFDLNFSVDPLALVEQKLETRHFVFFLVQTSRGRLTQG